VDLETYLLDRNRAVLVVVDVQGPFMKNIFERDRVISEVTKLVKAANILGVPVVTTLQNKARMGDVIPELAEVLPESEHIDKMTFSCGGADPFTKELERLGRYQVLLCGVETHVCINQTAIDLLRLNYDVQLVADAVSSRKESDWRIGIEKLRQAGVVITSTEAAIFEMLRDAAAAEFRAILEIVK
jgi:nicotinamidase-related amidase